VEAGEEEVVEVEYLLRMGSREDLWWHVGCKPAVARLAVETA